MSIKYTKIAKVEHVAGFDPKTGYYAYSKDDKRYIRFGNTLLECEEAPLKFQEQGKYTYVWYGSAGRFELYEGNVLIKSIESDINLLNRETEYIGCNRFDPDDCLVYFNVMSPFDAKPILRQDMPYQLYIETDIIIAYNNLNKEDVCRIDKDSNILWSFPLVDLGEDNVYMQGEVDHIVKMLGIVGGLLWFKTDFARLIALDITTGKPVYLLSCNPADEEKPQYKMVEGIGRCYLREGDKAIIGISSSGFQAIDTSTAEVIDRFIFREADPDGIGTYRSVFHPLLQGDYFTFLGEKEGEYSGIRKVGIFDYKARRLVWEGEVISEEEYRATGNHLVAPQPLYMPGDKLYIRDFQDTLHIFQRESRKCPGSSLFQIKALIRCIISAIRSVSFIV